MKIFYNDLKKGLDEYLLSQDGINKVNFGIQDKNDYVMIDFNNKLSHSIVANYIDLYQDDKWSTMLAFDKQMKNNLKKINYKVADICCEYCHMNFIRELFDNENIIAVSSDFSFNKPAINISYKISFDASYEEKQIIDTIQKILAKIGITYK